MNRILTAALAIGVITAAATAQHTKPRVGSTGSIDNMSKIWKTRGVSSQDRQFLMDAAAANWLEIRTSELAQMKGSSEWAKHFAKDMITDHKAAQEELKQLAQTEGIELPAQPPKNIQAMVNKLAKMDGPKFSSAYREVQIKGHEETAAKLANEIRDGHDTDVRNFAVKMLPIVKMHLKMAQTHQTMTHMGQ